MLNKLVDLFKSNELQGPTCVFDTPIMTSIIKDPSQFYDVSGYETLHDEDAKESVSLTEAIDIVVVEDEEGNTHKMPVYVCTVFYTNLETGFENEYVYGIDGVKGRKILELINLFNRA